MESIEVNTPPEECDMCGCTDFDVEDVDIDVFGTIGSHSTRKIGDLYVCVHCGQEYEVIYL